MSEGTKNIVESMKARGIRKVVGCMSGTTHGQKLTEWMKWSEFDLFSFFKHLGINNLSHLVNTSIDFR